MASLAFCTQPPKGNMHWGQAVFGLNPVVTTCWFVILGRSKSFGNSLFATIKLVNCQVCSKISKQIK